MKNLLLVRLAVGSLTAFSAEVKYESRKSLYYNLTASVDEAVCVTVTD